jgi:16S rRNA (uracil1498-N3)-methyltransferase
LDGENVHIPRIYLAQSLTENTTVELVSSAAHHIATVMRMKTGRSIMLFNGQLYQGMLGEFEATLAYVSKKSVAVAVGNFVERKTESPLAVELGACLIKNDRMDWLLQKATELGVTTITPLWSEYTDVKIPEDRIEKKMHHWQQVVINACEQSGRVLVPTVNPPQKIQAWMSMVNAEQKIVLHPYIESSSNVQGVASVALLVGPEGGLSESELALAMEQNFNGMVLGPRILRAETAPLAALTALQLQCGDF